MALVDDRGARFEDGGRSFDRQPPQDITAEQSVLGGMLLSKDAIADVVEVLRPGDFYRPAHQALYDCVLDLYGRGEPADAVTVSAELERRGELLRVGGAPYLHTLISTVPTAANAGYYAEIVAEKAVLRRLVEAGTRIVQLGYYGAEGADVDEVVDRAQSAVYEVTERRMSEDYVALEELLQPTMDEIDAIASRGGASAGVPTGFADLDAVTNGLHPGQMVIIAARPGIGKALALNTPLATPTGWTTMGEVSVGDQLLGADGRPTTVLAATDVLCGRPCYAVEFSDGSVIVADAHHEWLTDTRSSRRSRNIPAAVRTTREIAATLRCETADRRVNHSVRTCEPLQLPESELAVPPYTLGVWLGDGTSDSAHYTSADPEIAAYIEAEGLRVTPLGSLRFSLQLPHPAPLPTRDGVVCGTVQARLRTLGVLGNKHIPVRYLRAAEPQRRALLAGLLDTDGTVLPTGLVQFVVTNRRLAEDVRELVVGLGYRPGITARQARGRIEATSTAWAVTFSTDDDVFRLERKRITHKERRRYSPARTAHRYVVDVRPVPSEPVRCVEVDNGDHLYLAGRAMIPTHNSTLGLDFARSCSVTHGMASVIFSLEMSRTEIVMRLLSAEAKIRLTDMRSGRMSDDDWTRLARRMGEISEAPLFIDDSPNMTMMEIRAKARRLKQRHDLRLIVVDYMQLMTSGKRIESRQQEVSEFSRNLKLLAKELEVPVVTISQLNRGPEQRTDKKPMLADLRESGCLTRETALLRADTGAPVTFGALIDQGHEGVLLWSLDERRRLVAAPITNVFPSGVKDTFRLTLASGRTVTASGNHRFLTFAGWVPLDTLTPDDRIAVPRRIPAPMTTGLGWSEHRLGLLAHLIGDGCVIRSQPVHYTSQDEESLTFVEHATAAEFGSTARRGRGNPLHDWLGELGIEDLRGHQKRIPDVLYQSSDNEIRVFLHHLWAADGSIMVPTSRYSRKSQPGIYYSTSSRALADGVAILLARLNIPTRLHWGKYQKSERLGWHLVIAGSTAMTRFCQEVGAHGKRGESARAYLERYAETLDSDIPREAASDDVFWDRIISIEPLGPQPVYDATVKGTHNFIADGVVAHNSLEQDADMVMLIHRPDAWERDDPRAGEADLILAKHRNGPTTTVTVAHQLHYSRFFDMAQS